jgi:tetratricopeptide (TPR) repeat protein
MFDCQALGRIEVKGLPQLVEAWQVRGELTGVSRFEALHAAALSPFVGREEEIELLLRRWHQAKLGEGRVVLLAGEPGIGKSRIAESMLVELESQPHVRLRYFCSPHHIHSVLYPFIAQLERAAGFSPVDGTGAKLDKLEVLLKPTTRNVPQDLALIADLLGLLVDHRYPVVDVSPQQKRQMTLNALLSQLRAIAAQSPVLIVFEDAHWIDPTSLDLLDRTVTDIAELPVLMVVTFRPEFQPAWVGQPHVTMLPLSRLGRRDVASMIAGVTKGKAMPDAVVEQILARTDGVPLFVEELTNTLLESGLLRETPERYVLDGPLPPLAIPATLQASLLARLDRLATVKDVAQIGAAIGREFSRELIAAVSGLAPPVLDAALERLSASGLISRRGGSSDASYSFKHALVQDAAYDSLLKSRRQQLHARIAKVVVERFPTMVESLPEVVAHHLTQAGLAGEAITYWRKAGQLASKRSANLEAVKFFEQAVDLLPSLTQSPSTLEQGFDIRLELRPALVQLGQVRRALSHLREAETLAEGLNDERRRSQISAFLTNALTLLGELDDAVATGSRAVDIASRVGDLTLRLQGTTYLEQAHHFRGDYERVVELAIENLTALPTEQVYTGFGSFIPISVYDRNWLVMSLAELGRFTEAAQHGAQAITLAKPTRHGFSIGLAHDAAGRLHLLKGDWAQAHSLIEEGIRAFQTGNTTLALPRAVAASAWAFAQVGNSSEVLTRLENGQQLLERQAASGTIDMHAMAYHSLGRAALLLDRVDEARRFAERAIGCPPSDRGYVIHALHLLGDIATHPDQFDAERAAGHYAKALVLATARGMRPLIAHCHLGLGTVYRRTGNRQQAQEQLANAKAMYREMEMRFWLRKSETEVRQLA